MVKFPISKKQQVHKIPPIFLYITLNNIISDLSNINSELPKNSSEKKQKMELLDQFLKSKTLKLKINDL